MKLIFCFLFFLSTNARAQDLTDAVSGWTRTQKKPTRKTKSLQRPAALADLPKTEPKKWPPTARELCNKDLAKEEPPDIRSEATKCAKNFEEIKTFFPQALKSVNGLRGTYSDNLPGDYEERVFEFQQKSPDNFKRNDLVPLIFTAHTLRCDEIEGFLRIQLQDFNQDGVLARGETKTAELCQGPEGFYFKAQGLNIPIKFQGPKCLWVAVGGHWTALRKANDLPPEFSAPVQRAPPPPKFEATK